MRSLVATALFLPALLAGLPAAAQNQGPVYQEPKKLRFTLEALARYEWTQDIFVTATTTREESRFVSWAFPGLEANLGKFQLGVAGGFYWSDEKNYEEPIAPPQRDNFRSRDARLDRAFAKFEASWIRLEAGRFTMPIAFTEMIWDKELKPQGGALRLGVQDRGSLKSFGVTGLYAKGSHVFEDETEMFALSAEAVFAAGTDGSAQLVGSYVEFRNLETVPPFLRRQNSRTPSGLIGPEFKVVDGVIRVRRAGALPLQLVANYCWNTAADTDNTGLWLAAALGSVRSSRARLDYTYAKVDRDATLGEYAADDFFWTTGWEGHRADLGFRVDGRGRASLHGVAQWQRFKDSPREAERDDWQKRFRVELRIAN